MKNTLSPSIRIFVCLVVASVAPSFMWASEQDGSPATKALTPDALAGLPITLNAAQQQTLLNTGILTRYYDSAVQTGLCPQSAAALAMTASLNAVKPSIGIETLIVYPLPEKMANNPDKNLVLYNLMHHFKSMKGIEYYSASRKAMRVFFTASNLVQSPDKRDALPDPVYTTVEASHQLYLDQEDQSFGRNLYDLFVQSPAAGTVLLNMSNRDQIWYGIAPVLGPHALSLYLFAQASPDGKYLYFYGNAAISATKAFGLEERAKTSYTNRIIAMFNWYAKEIESGF